MERFRDSTRDGQGGWALVETLAATLVVMLAFVATLGSIEASTSTSARDVHKTAAFDIAQNELENMRAQGEANVSELLLEDNSSTPVINPGTGVANETVVLNGTKYWVYKRAYYVQSDVSDTTDPCGGLGNQADAAITAQYVYLKVTVVWDGMSSATAGSTTATGPTGAPDQQPATLEGFFAAEGGNLQANSSSLRIFVQNSLGVAQSSRTAHLYKMPTNQLIATKTTNINGCAIFTGLARADYEVRIPTTTEYDLYLTTNPVKYEVHISNRQIMTRTIKLDSLATVTPTFVSNNGSADFTVTPGSAVSELVSTPAGAPNWTAYSTQFSNAASPDFAVNYAFLPPASPKPADMLFPIPPIFTVTPNLTGSGYGLYGGPCAVNDPDDADAGNGSERTLIPTANNLSWFAGNTYSTNPQLRLPSLRFKILNNSSAATAGGQIQVRLVGKAGGSLQSTSQCGSRGALFSKWVRLPGQTASTGYLQDMSYALPAGLYNACARRGTGSGIKQKGDVLTTGATWSNTFPGPNSFDFKIKDADNITSGSDACGDPSLWD